MRYLLAATLLLTGLSCLSLAGAGATPQPLLGADMISPASPNWNQHIALLQQMKGEVVRYRLDEGFGPNPAEIPQLIDAGVGVIILNTAAGADWATTYHEYVTDGFEAQVLAHPNTQFYLEMGNEPDDIAAYKPVVIDVAQHLQQHKPANLGILVSMPLTLANTHALLDDGALLGLVDGLAPHIYGGDAIGDGAGLEMPAVYQYSLTLGKPLWITEMGIDDGNLPKAEKAQRMRDWISQQPAQLKGVTVFAISDLDGPNWQHYLITPEMAAVFASRLSTPAQVPASVTPIPWPGVTPTPASTPLPTPAAGDSHHVYFAQTGHWLSNGFLDFWQSHGGVTIFGYPLTEEYTDPATGLTIQAFERAVMEYHPEAPAGYRVMLRRIGAEWLQQQGGN